jgi:hypothetical protein
MVLIRFSERLSDLGEWRLPELPRSQSGGHFLDGSSHTLDQLDSCFDDTHAIANAGLLLPATLAERLGIQQAADQLIDLGQRPGAAHPGAKLLTVVHSILAGGDCIDDTDVLRCGATSQVLGHRCWHPPRSAPSCAHSPSATPASSTGSPSRSSSRRGRRAPDPTISQ